MAPNDTITPDILYTPSQVATLLHCSRTHVYRLMSSGALAWVDISVPGTKSTKSRIRKDALEAYLNGAGDNDRLV